MWIAASERSPARLSAEHVLARSAKLDKYGLAFWVTECALVEWNEEGRLSDVDSQDFFRCWLKHDGRSPFRTSLHLVHQVGWNDRLARSQQLAHGRRECGASWQGVL
jgi:hypothetical protein